MGNGAKKGKNPGESDMNVVGLGRACKGGKGGKDVAGDALFAFKRR